MGYRECAEMTKSIPSIMIILAICSIVGAIPDQCIGQEYYQKGNNRLIRSNPDVPLVKAFDMQAFNRDRLPGFRIVEKHALYYTEVVYRLENLTTNFTLYIEVGLFPSVREAEGAKLDRLIMSTAWFKEGPILGEQVGG